MRFKIVILMAVAGLLGACSTAPTSETASVSGAGTASGATSGATTGVVKKALSIEPGSEQDLKVNVGDRVFFAFDRYGLSPQARATLQKQAVWLKAHKNVVIIVQGNTDERGTREYNLALGERRASSTADYLKSLGIAGSRISTISYGKERPVNPASNEAAWAQNRRAVTVVK